MSTGAVDVQKRDPWGLLEDTYLDSPDAWDVLADIIRAAGVCGLDTEFYGLDVRKESCVARAKVHVWSIAVRTVKRSPLGFHKAVGWVLPAAALHHPAIAEVLANGLIKKCVHNQPVDDHAIHNHGVRLAGCINTLDYVRWKWPWLVTQGGFGLKNLMMVKLRRAPVCEYIDVVNDVRQIEVRKTKRVSQAVCECGNVGCRKRKEERLLVADFRGEPRLITHGKSKVEQIIEVVETKDEKFKHPLESIVPGHPRWELLVKYAAEDAVAALEIEELAWRERDPAPYPYGEREPGLANFKPRHLDRPTFNQKVCDAVVLMEREGFPIDVQYSADAVTLAEIDENRELEWLHKWFVINGAVTYGPHRREEVDDIWSSPKQLGEMFDELEFPRSPIWKKGKVKPGDIKLDGTALKWIGRNYKPAKQMIDHLLQLKKVRAGKKYMVKLRDSGGWVNVICGPAGDADDRNGAVTGRLGIKGTLEAQQLPSKEEVDLYKVRKAIVATDMRAQ